MGNLYSKFQIGNISENIDNHFDCLDISFEMTQNTACTSQK